MLETDIASFRKPFNWDRKSRKDFALLDSLPLVGLLQILEEGLAIQNI